MKKLVAKSAKETLAANPIWQRSQVPQNLAWASPSLKK
jgi:hypothetical protein